MNLSADDAKILRKGAGPLLFSLVVALIFGGAGQYFYQRVKSENEAQQRALAAAKNRLVRVQQNVQIIADYLGRFDQMVSRGRIDKELRLEWVETLRLAAEKLKLSTVRYKVDGQKVFSTDYISASGNYEIRVSDMNLAMEIPHEGDLFRVFESLLKQDVGVFDVKSCSLQRLDETVRLQGGTANVAADCNLRWFSVGLQREGQG